MQKTKKTQSPMVWVLGQTGDHGGQYILSVALAIIGVAFSLASYFVVRCWSTFRAWRKSRPIT